MLTCTGFAAQSADAPLEKFTFNRRDVGETDVQVEILFCGVCHSDLHRRAMSGATASTR